MADFAPPQPERPLPDPAEVTIESSDPNAVRVDPSGALEIPLPDGSVVIDLNPDKGEDDDGEDFGANLAEHLDDDYLLQLADELLRAIDSDDRSRDAWMNTRKRGIDLLGVKLEEPRGDISASSAPLEGMSTVRHPLLLEAVLRFQATARGELLPSTGPAKVRVDGGEDATVDQQAEALERGFNHYLTAVATEYYPDTDRMLFLVGSGGCAFKKVYNCPIRRRPVSESVDAKDLIVSNAANDLRSAGRVTHEIIMRPSVLKRMQLAGAYRTDVTLTQPVLKPSVVDEKVAEQQGVAARPERPEDQPHTIFECYCELNIPGFEHEDEDGEKTGLELPYRVAIEEDSRQILEIRRNWDEEDKTCLAKQCFVKFPFVPALGFYDLGLIHILGNSTAALTAAWREMLDAGMYACFPGFLYSKVAGRQLTNEFRIPPGGGMPIDTGSNPIGNMVMPLPYRDISAGLVGLVQDINSVSQRVGGTAETPVGDGSAEIPVGTVLALIEQATKIQDAVHKRLHAAQAEELGLLKDCFRRDPEAFWRFNKSATPQDRVQFLSALDNYNIVPAADPNTPSHMHRIMKAVAVKQLSQANPELYNAKEVDTRILRMIGWADPEGMFAPPQPPPGPVPPDPVAMQANQLKAEEIKLKRDNMALDMQDNAAERQSREDLAVLNLAKELAVHAQNQNQQAADRALALRGTGPSQSPHQPKPKGRVF